MKQELELDKLLKELSRFDVRMIDDFGYVKQNRDEMEVVAVGSVFFEALEADGSGVLFDSGLFCQ